MSAPATAVRSGAGNAATAPAGGAGLEAAPDRTVTVRTLGRFSVRVDGEEVEPAVWQSRKARDLLKILVARRGRPATRDMLMEALWSGSDPVAVGPRLSVALSIARTVLDPAGSRERDFAIRSDRWTVMIDLNNVAVDVERFLAEARAGLAGDDDALRAAESLYGGEFLEPVAAGSRHGLGMERITGTHRLRGRMTSVGPGIADTELAERGTSLASRLAFLDETTFCEEGTIDFGNGDSVHFRSLGSGTRCRERSTGLRRGRSVLEVDGGAGRLAGARGRITSSFVVADDGEVIDERVVDVFVKTEEK